MFITTFYQNNVERCNQGVVEVKTCCMPFGKFIMQKSSSAQKSPFALTDRVFKLVKRASGTVRIRIQSLSQTLNGKTGKHILPNNKITGEKPS